MAAAELTIAELQQLVQATIVQSKAVSEAGAKTAERLDGLQESLDKYASSSAKAFDALATTTTSSLARTESTLGRVLVVHNSLDAAMAEMRKFLDGFVHRVDILEQPTGTTIAQGRRTEPPQTERQSSDQHH